MNNRDPLFQGVHRDAKRLCKAARSGDPGAIAVIRAAFPEAAPQSDPDLTAWLNLSRAQHALAIQRGYQSWRDMRQSLLQPITKSASLARKQVFLPPAPGPIMHNYDGSEAMTIEQLRDHLEGWPADYYVTFSGGLSFSRMKSREVNQVDIELTPMVWIDRDKNEVYIDELDR